MERERLFEMAFEADLKRRQDQDRRARGRAADLAALLRLLVSTRENHDETGLSLLLGQAKLTINYIDTGQPEEEQP